MKKIILASIAGFMWVSTSAAFAQAEPVRHAGFLKSVRGQVELIDTASQSRPARAGDEVAAADRIVTRGDGGASLVLRDGTTLIIGPGSELDLKQYRFDSTTHDGNILVSLLQGSMRMISGLIGKSHPEAVRVDTQTATIGIRGTDFIVTADNRL